MTNKQKEAEIKAFEEEMQNIKKHRKPLDKDGEIKITVTAIQEKGKELHVSNDRQRPIISEEPTMSISTDNNREKDDKDKDIKEEKDINEK